MGSCVGKLCRKSAASGDAEDVEPKSETTQPARVTVDLEKLPADRVKLGALDATSIDALEAVSPHSAQPVHHESSLELSKAVQFWDRDSRVRHLSTEELKSHYDKDSDTLLDTLETLEQYVKEKKRDKKDIAALSRGSNALSRAFNASNTRAHRASDEARKPSSEAGLSLDSLSNKADIASGASDRYALGRMLKKDNDLTRACQHFQDGKMLGALKIVRSWCSRYGVGLDELQAHSDSLGFEINELISHCQSIKEMLAQLENDAGYSVSRDDEQLKVMYKSVHRCHYIKMEATLPHPLERPLSLAREFDLMETWNDYVKDSRLLLAPNIWESFVYAGLWMPFPFPQIDALAKGRGYDLSVEDRSLLIRIESVTEEELPPGAGKIPHKASKRKRADVMPGSTIRLEALEPAADGTHRTKGTILAIVDPKIPHVPAFIISFVLGVIAPFAHKQIVKLLKTEFDDPSKTFARRLKTQPELYDRVRKVVAEGLKLHYGTPIPAELLAAEPVAAAS